MTGNISVQLGCPKNLHHSATELFVTALNEKLSPFLGEPERAAAFLTASVNGKRMFVALCDGKVVGVAGFKRDGKGLFEPGFASFYQEYGLSAPLRMAGLMLLERPEEGDCLLMDGIAVADGMRGKGIGTRLLEAIENHARNLDCKSIRLDVIDTNPNARRLYERFGFVAGKTRGTGFLAPLFSFRSSTEMYKNLS